MSLKELWLERRYARQKHQDERDRDVILAWQIMRIKLLTQNHKRLPSLKSLLARPETAGTQKAALHQLAAQLGVPIVRRPRE